MTETLELYYAEMESERNASEDAYFKARHPSFDREDNRKMFRAGFERAFSPLWHRLHAAERELKLVAEVGGRALQELHAKVTSDALEPHSFDANGSEV